MSVPADQSWHVMISSTMRDLGSERAIVHRAVQEAQLESWWAEDPPPQFASNSPREFCRLMAEQCDLFVLILGPSYGYSPDGTLVEAGRSVTQMEFDWARQENAHKLLIFVRSDALDTDDAQQSAFIHAALDFDTGYTRYLPFTSLEMLDDQVRSALAAWKQQESQIVAGYLRMVRRNFSEFTSLLTGEPQPIESSVPLQLRTAEETPPTPDGAEPTEPSESPPLRTFLQFAGALVPRFLPINRRGRPSFGSQPKPVPDIEFIIDSVQAQLDTHSHLVLLGDPGAGKSTTLRRLAYETAVADLQRSGAQWASVPIWCTAAELSSAISQAPQVPLPSILGQLVAADTGLPQMGEAIRVVVQRGEALILVDGLDEVADPSQRQVLFAILRAVGTNQAILTARPAAYREHMLPDWHICGVQELNQQAQRIIIGRVLHEAGGLEAETDHVLSVLQKRRDVRNWSANPLLLTLLVSLYARNHTLPGERATIYRFAVETLLSSRQTGLHQLTQDTVERLVQQLAFQMLERGVVVATAEEIATWVGIDPSTDTSTIPELLDRAAVLQQREPGQWSFIHLTFQEYLAAAALTRLGEQERQRAIVRHRFSAQWVQVLPLLVSELDRQQAHAAASSVIDTLVAADDQHVPQLRRRDPTHLALRRALACERNQPARGAMDPPEGRVKTQLRRLRRRTSRVNYALSAIMVGSIILGVAWIIFAVVAQVAIARSSSARMGFGPWVQTNFPRLFLADLLMEFGIWPFALRRIVGALTPLTIAPDHLESPSDTSELEPALSVLARLDAENPASTAPSDTDEDELDEDERLDGGPGGWTRAHDELFGRPAVLPKKDRGRVFFVLEVLLLVPLVLWVLLLVVIAILIATAVIAGVVVTTARIIMGIGDEYALVPIVLLVVVLALTYWQWRRTSYEDDDADDDDADDDDAQFATDDPVLDGRSILELIERNFHTDTMAETLATERAVIATEPVPGAVEDVHPNPDLALVQQVTNEHDEDMVPTQVKDAADSFREKLLTVAGSSPEAVQLAAIDPNTATVQQVAQMYGSQLKKRPELMPDALIIGRILIVVIIVIGTVGGLIFWVLMHLGMRSMPAALLDIVLAIVTDIAFFSSVVLAIYLLRQFHPGWKAHERIEESMLDPAGLPVLRRALRQRRAERVLAFVTAAPERVRTWLLIAAQIILIVPLATWVVLKPMLGTWYPTWLADLTTMRSWSTWQTYVLLWVASITIPLLLSPLGLLALNSSKRRVTILDTFAAWGEQAKPALPEVCACLSRWNIEDEQIAALKALASFGPSALPALPTIAGMLGLADDKSAHAALDTLTELLPLLDDTGDATISRGGQKPSFFSCFS